ncbi:MAG: hypothetical protein Q8M34_00755 [Thermodesulfovibrionales bacterium]|nr:hypothetical protein [Thermodesulfovibrionales bacterium]
MSFEEKIFFTVKTPLNIEVRTTVQYWEYLTTLLHSNINNEK